jgi:hypothetical protein
VFDRFPVEFCSLSQPFASCRLMSGFFKSPKIANITQIGFCGGLRSCNHYLLGRCSSFELFSSSAIVNVSISCFIYFSRYIAVTSNFVNSHECVSVEETLKNT